MIRIACRHMLPLEMGVVLLSSMPLALTILLGRKDGPVWQMFAGMPTFAGFSQNTVWGLFFLLAALVLFIAAAVEWFVGRGWERPALHRAALVRFWSSAALLIAHGCFAWQLIVVLEWSRAMALSFQSAPAVALLCWIAWKTLRVSVALNPSIKTDTLERTILIENL